MRAIWKGSISFGLVNIPVALFPATRSEELKFRLLREGDLSPVNYKRVAETDGKEVTWDKIVKGYEYEKGKFVVLKDEDFKRVDIEATRTVDLLTFVALKEVNPVFFQKPYYMEPQKGGDRAYALLRDALQGSEKIGIAKVVIKTRQHLAAVKPQDEGLMLELMHFPEELRSLEDFRQPGSVTIAKKELEMARSLIASMTETWNPDDYKDDYREAVEDMIEKKIASGGKSAGKAPARKKASNVIDLVAVLEQSLAAKPGKPGKPAKSTRKAAAKASADTAKKAAPTRKRA